MNDHMTTVLTGASSGIGYEMAQLLAARGHRLVLASRSAAGLEKAADSLRRERNAQVHTLAIDLAEPGAAKRLFEFTQSQQLRVDALVNNAGFGLLDEHMALNPERLHHMLQLNIVAVVELCQRFGTEMKKRRSGRILNIASSAAFQPTPYFAAYGASKAFVLNFSEALAKELEDFGVSVSCLCPGPTDTAFFDTVDPGRISGDHHFGKRRRANPASVAPAGVDLMLGGGLSQVVGLGQRALVFANRLAPRAAVASLSKRLLQPRKTSAAALR